MCSSSFSLLEVQQHLISADAFKDFRKKNGIFNVCVPLLLLHSPVCTHGSNLLGEWLLSLLFPSPLPVFYLLPTNKLREPRVPRGAEINDLQTIPAEAQRWRFWGRQGSEASSRQDCWNERLWYILPQIGWTHSGWICVEEIQTYWLCFLF